MDDANTLRHISEQIIRLNRALGHKRGQPRVTLATATPAQIPLG